MENHFCSCPVESCNKHPSNHDLGCDLCIKKNLDRKEIPSCFFLKVSTEVGDVKEYSFESFTNFYLKNKNN